MQAYRTLQGKYDAETGRAKEQMSAMSARLRDLENLLSQPAETTQPAATPTDSVQSLLTEEEVEDYGQDMIDVIKRAAREAVGQELDTLRAENAQLKQQLGGVQQTTAMSARQTMLNDLDRQQSDWRQINTDPAFMQWAEDIDAFSGQRRIDMLRQAFEENNGPRVLAFFQTFARENAAFKTSGPTETATPQPQVSLESLVAPGRASDGSIPRAQEENAGRQWTSAQIQKFYSDVQRGVYKNDPAKKAAIEADIVAAQRQGRFVG
jgi:hypothetical protein